MQELKQWMLLLLILLEDTSGQEGVLVNEDMH